MGTNKYFKKKENYGFNIFTYTYLSPTIHITINVTLTLDNEIKETCIIKL